MLAALLPGPQRAMPWAAPVGLAPRIPSQLGHSGPLLSEGPRLGPLSRGRGGVRSVHARPQERGGLGWEVTGQVHGHLPPAAQGGWAGEGALGELSREGAALEAQGLPDPMCDCGFASGPSTRCCQACPPSASAFPVLFFSSLGRPCPD